MISKSAMHALTALTLLSKLSEGEYAGAAAIAKEIKAPQNYLGKLLQQLANEGIVTSQKGYGGGFRLARAADKIALYEIVDQIDNVSRWGSCFLTHGNCSDKRPCAVHDRWSRVREEYLDFLKSTSIADLASKRVRV